MPLVLVPDQRPRLQERGEAFLEEQRVPVDAGANCFDHTVVDVLPDECTRWVTFCLLG